MVQSALIGLKQQKRAQDNIKKMKMKVIQQQLRKPMMMKTSQKQQKQPRNYFPNLDFISGEELEPEIFHHAMKRQLECLFFFNILNQLSYHI